MPIVSLIARERKQNKPQQNTPFASQILPMFAIILATLWIRAFIHQVSFYMKEIRNMASYIEGTLIKGEKLVYVGNISLWTLAPLLLLGFVLLIAYGLGVIVFLIAYIKYKTTELAFTNKRVVAKFGFISRRTMEINITKVESIQVHQNIMGRIFNYGSLVITGSGESQAPIVGISNPMEFRRAFMEAQDMAQKDQ
ncbi:PH domain-containing protein [Undibacterium sp. Ren11W]|uniref:PH domain-containing protein n=1 Tax=Undibacterium sp. Ren11W TaxID=3413045 RepID=UPI003BF0DE96